MISVSNSWHGIRKIEVTYFPVISVGIVSSSGVIYDIRHGQTALITFMISNNESGFLQHVVKVAAHFR